ncbi:hypothetical protein Cpir12675_003064 [Ceratocystis pirilliformis]|uniref:Alpha-taxilin n=1 Tax=Ceratocystis pirilliformis TaxID=259994 RepID=A0ABR3Z578_9PEZI
MSSTNGYDAGSATRKGKNKKPIDPNDSTSRLLEAKINQLEREAASDKDQEAEIEREVKRANRDLVQQISKLDELHKIDLLLRRASELMADLRRMEKENMKNKKRGDALQKDKDAKMTELGRTNQLKEKLEKLCRELQKDNNKLKNENKTLQDNLARTTKAHDLRMESVLGKLEGYQKEKDNPRQEVIDVSMEELFRQRFKTLIEQYELRDLHFQAQLRTKELEVQYNMVRFEAQKRIAEDEVAKGRQLQSQVQGLSSSDAELRSQVNRYAEKFKQVEDTLTNSNELFSTFRKEIEDMSKRNRVLERENKNLKRKQRVSDESLIQMAGEREDWRAQASSSKHKTGSGPESASHPNVNGIEICPSDQTNGSRNGEGHSHHHHHHHHEPDENSEDSTVDNSDDGYHTSDAESDTMDYPGMTNTSPPAQCASERPTYGPERPPGLSTAPRNTPLSASKS